LFPGRSHAEDSGAIQSAWQFKHLKTRRSCIAFCVFDVMSCGVIGVAPEKQIQHL